MTATTIDLLGIGDYAMYMFDFGAPVGFRIALAHDQRVRGIVSQNGNAYTGGFGPGVGPEPATPSTSTPSRHWPTSWSWTGPAAPAT